MRFFTFRFLLFGLLFIFISQGAWTQDIYTFNGKSSSSDWTKKSEWSPQLPNPKDMGTWSPTSIIIAASDDVKNFVDIYIPSTVKAITLAAGTSITPDDINNILTSIKDSQVTTLELVINSNVTFEIPPEGLTNEDIFDLSKITNLTIDYNATLTLNGVDLSLPSAGAEIELAGLENELPDTEGKIVASGEELIVIDNERVWGNCAIMEDCLPDHDGNVVTGPITISNISTVLPIELMYFKAQVENREVHLNWQSVWELNNEYYTLERSPDGEHYEEVVRLDGAGNSSEPLDYYYTDKQPLERLSWYRLSQTDYDGTKEVFDPIKVNLDPLYKAKAVISPNPAPLGEFELALEGFLPEQKVKVTMTDLLGITLFEQEVTTNDEGYYVLEMSIPYSIPSGFYNFLCRSSSGTLISRALLQR